MIFPRTGEITPRKTLSIQGSTQLVAIEPQHVVEATGTQRDSVVGFIPNPSVEGHYGLGRCEVGLVLVTLGMLAEVRCGLLRQSHGDPLSVAVSGAAGSAIRAGGPDFTPAARFGLDVSRRFGHFEPLVDVYLSTSSETHFVQTGVVSDPVIAPTGITMGRQEIRVSVPLGFAILTGRTDRMQSNVIVSSVTVGLEPWFTLWASSHVEIEPVVRSYATSYGLAVTLGMAFQ